MQFLALMQYVIVIRQYISPCTKSHSSLQLAPVFYNINFV